MNYDSLSIRYQSVNPGTDKTDCFFYADIASALHGLKTDTNSRIFVTDETIFALPPVQDLLSKIDKEKNALVIIKSGEKYKTIETLLDIITTAIKSGLHRSSIFTGIGGGVVCDITAFAASLFKRGAQLELIPTTLLAMVDAAIGGKTGCDFLSYKNMIGSFYPAKTISIAAEFVQSQTEKEFLSGLAESVKTAMLYAPKLFQILQDNKDEILRREQNIMLQLIKRCATDKAHIVEKDLMEAGPRMQLNLGHTFAHALETCVGLGKLTHGEAVAWGLGRAIQLSFKLGYCSADYRDDVFALLSAYNWSTAPMHPAAKNIAGEALLSAMKKDKKNKSLKVRLILQREINSTLIEEVDDKDILNILK